MKPTTMPPGCRCQSSNILKNTGFVVGKHDRQDFRLAEQRLRKTRSIASTMTIDSQLLQLPALLLQLHGRFENTRMLTGANADQTGFQACSSALDKQVVCFATATGKNNLRRMRIDRCGNALPRFIDRLASLPTVLVTTRRIAELAFKPR